MMENLNMSVRTGTRETSGVVARGKTCWVISEQLLGLTIHWVPLYPALSRCTLEKKGPV